MEMSNGVSNAKLFHIYMRLCAPSPQTLAWFHFQSAHVFDRDCRSVAN